MSATDTCIIYNPAAGRGRARREVEAARKWASPHAELRATTGPGHAVELARTAAIQGFRRVVAAGGDGTTHEVANGLLQAGASDCRLAVWPLGSSNDYAAALGLRDWWRSRGAAGLRLAQVDAARIHGGGRERFYVNCLGIGFNGLVSVEAGKIRGLRGLPLYTLALLKTLAWQFATPPLRVQLDDVEVHKPTLALSLNLGPREGGFPITKNARLDDGFLDSVHVSNLQRWELIRYLPALITGNLPTDHPKLMLGRCQRAEVSSEHALCVHADGEIFLAPAAGVNKIQVEILPGALTVEMGAVPNLAE